MTIRFRLSDQAFLQQKTLQVPMPLLEQLVQPAWRGSAKLLSARELNRLPVQLRLMARRFLGLYVVADGQGLITQIAKMPHRIAIAEQDPQFALSGQTVASANEASGSQQRRAAVN